MELMTRKRLVVFGEKFWRPYIHVRDAARGIQKVLEAPSERVKNEVFNVGCTEQNYQKQQIVDLILPYADGAAVEYVHRQEDPRDYRVSFAKIKNTLGFEITRTVQDGVAEIARLVKDGVIVDFTDPRFRN
jgi:nucleoside-diphosphate-sugar epimerase